MILAAADETNIVNISNSTSKEPPTNSNRLYAIGDYVATRLQTVSGSTEHYVAIIQGYPTERDMYHIMYLHCHETSFFEGKPGDTDTVGEECILFKMPQPTLNHRGQDPNRN